MGYRADEVLYGYRPIGGVRHTALDHVSFTVDPGQIVGISGRTGRYDLCIQPI